MNGRRPLTSSSAVENLSVYFFMSAPAPTPPPKSPSDSFISCSAANDNAARCSSSRQRSPRLARRALPAWSPSLRGPLGSIFGCRLNYFPRGGAKMGPLDHTPPSAARRARQDVGSKRSCRPSAAGAFFFPHQITFVFLAILNVSSVLSRPNTRRRSITTSLKSNYSPG